jgi:trans-aconitate methyltransferase
VARTHDLTRGNAAKLYCLRELETLARSRESFRIVDLGAGDAKDFTELLRRLPHVDYVAVEPDANACRRAERNLTGTKAEVVHAFAYDIDRGPADAVVSFSVLEHVYDRPAYLNAVARNLAPGGAVFVNYDSGHFTRPSLRDRAKTGLGAILARAGREHHYQAFVREDAFRQLVAEAGLEVVEAKSFNTCLKLLYRLVPDDAADVFGARWLDFELGLDGLVPPYRDEHAWAFMTRNFVLRHA